MARHAEGWKLVWKRGIAHVRFRVHGQRQQVTTGQKDSVKAAAVAAQIYADFVSGSVKRGAAGALIHPGTEIVVLCADWIADIMPELGDDTDTTYAVYARHWADHFKTIGTVRTPGIGAYQRQRLRSVQRSTVVKERGALRRFLSWCVEKELLGEVPEFPPLPKKAKGERHKQGRGKPQIELSVADVEAILAACPERSLRTRKGKHFAVRAYFVACYETALRPDGTVDRLLGKDVTLAGLHIRKECDKNRWERVVPLSVRAREAMTGAKPDEPIFGVHDRRVVFRQACIKALGPERGKLVTTYDLKHARVTHWVDAGGSPTGIAFMTGTKAALARYTHPSRRSAEELLGGNMGAGPTVSECEGEDLNLHGSYPASTSSKLASAGQREIGSDVGGDSPQLTVSDSLLGARHPIDFWLKARAWFARSSEAA